MDGWRDGWISRQIPFIFGFRGFQGHLSPRTSNFRDRALSASGEDATLRECSKRPRSDILGFDREKRQRRGRRRKRKKEGEEVKGGQAPEQGNKGTTVASQSRSERVIASQGCSGREFFYFFR